MADILRHGHVCELPRDGDRAGPLGQLQAKRLGVLAARTELDLVVVLLLGIDSDRWVTILIRIHLNIMQSD